MNHGISAYTDMTFVPGNDMAEVKMNIEQARFNMIQQQIRPWDVLDPAVLKLLATVKREDFVPEGFKELAFADVEVPLNASGQTMLPPKMEARILQELGICSTDTVLEIGTGSGFMAALLAANAESVISIEIDPAQAETARSNLRQAGIANVSVETGDGALGWPARGPYDAIVLSGSMPTLPSELLQQLKPGGRLVGVIGEAPVMTLQRITRTGADAFNTINVFETVVAPLLNARASGKFVF